MMQLVSFAFGALFLLFGHFIAWLAIVKIFALSVLSVKLILALVLGLLFLSILLSAVLVHKWDNTFTRLYYLSAMFWLGTLLNLGLILIATLILKFLLPLIGLNLSINFYRGFIILGTLSLSFWGVYNSHNYKVKEYEVKIKDLPVAWYDQTIVHISDVHLGPIYRQKTFARIINKVNKLEPAAVFITGDLFDGMKADFSWLTPDFIKFKTSKGVFYAHGNHDLYLDFDRINDLLKDYDINVLDNKLKVVDGLQIIGINYSFNQDFDLHQEILNQSGYDEKKASLLLFHEPKNIDLAVKAGIDLQLSGHTHRGQLFPIGLFVNLFYKGYGYGLFQIGSFSLIVNSGLGTWGPPMRTSGNSEIVKVILKPL